MRDLAKSLNPTKQQASEEVSYGTSCTAYENEIRKLVQGLHEEQLKVVVMQYAKVEERIVKAVQKMFEDMSKASCLCSTNGPPEKNDVEKQVAEPNNQVLLKSASAFGGHHIAQSASAFAAASAFAGHHIAQSDPPQSKQSTKSSPPASMGTATGTASESAHKAQPKNLEVLNKPPPPPPVNITRRDRKKMPIGSTILPMSECDDDEPDPHSPSRKNSLVHNENMKNQVAQFGKNTASVNVSKIAQFAGRGRKDSSNNLEPESRRALIERYLSDNRVETAILLVIISNTIYMAWHTDHVAKTLHEPSNLAIRVTEVFFTVFFCVDLTLRLYVDGRFFLTGCNWRWNLLDFIVVVTALLEELMLLLSSTGGGSALSSTKVIRVLRILRLIRIIRFIRGASFFTELRALCLGIFQTVGSLFWALLLLFIVIFIFSVYLTQGVAYYLIEQSEIGENGDMMDHHLRDKFGSLGLTMYSLWKAITGGADWESFCDPLFDVSPLMGSIFVLFIAFAVCAMMNVVTGIFVNKALKVAEGDVDLVIIANSKQRQDHIEAVKRIFEQADVHNSGKLSRDAFASHFKDPCVQAFFAYLDVDLDGVPPDHLFDILDVDGDGAVSADEFIFGCSTMKGHARSLDLARLSFNLQRQCKDLSEQISKGPPATNQRNSDRKASMKNGNMHEIDKVRSMVNKVVSAQHLTGPLGSKSSMSCPPVAFKEDHNHQDQSHQIAPVSALKAALDTPSPPKAAVGSAPPNGIHEIEPEPRSHSMPMLQPRSQLSSQALAESAVSIFMPVAEEHSGNLVQDPQSEVRFEVFFGDWVVSLGFAVEWRLPTPMVGEVYDKGEAQIHGILSGDLIDYVNDHRTEGLSREELLPLFKIRPLTLGLRRARNELS